MQDALTVVSLALEDSLVLLEDVVQYNPHLEQVPNNVWLLTVIPCTAFDRDSLVQLLTELLELQFVCHGRSSAVYRVTRGSIMGGLFSSELSDVTFCNLVEVPFTLDPRVQREYGVAH